MWFATLITKQYATQHFTLSLLQWILSPIPMIEGGFAINLIFSNKDLKL
jgi:hypothetical protein